MKIISLFAVIMTVTSLASLAFFAHAQLPPSDAASQDDEPNVKLYVPEHMMLNHTYTGMVTYTGHHERAVLVDIATNRDALTIDDSVVIPAQKHHATFSIVPTHAGVFAISVQADNITILGTTTVHEGGHTTVATTAFDTTTAITDAHSLLLFVPGLTQSEELIGAVYLVDSLQNPVISPHDISVSLATSSQITAPASITISEGSTAASFQIHITTTGSIHATSDGMHDYATITKKSPKFSMLLDVYPKIMQENSFGYWFLWFEDSEGNPYIPPDVVYGTVHSSNKDVARMQPQITGRHTSSVATTFSDGVQYGRIYTGDAGFASVTGTVPGFGGVSRSFVVGPASFGTSTIVNDTISDAPTLISPEMHADRLPHLPAANDLRFTVIPPVTVSEAYIVAGLYHSVLEESIRVDADDVVIARTVTDVYPVNADAREIYISSDGAIHNSIEILDTSDIPTHVNLYDVSGVPGTYRISVTAPQVSPASLGTSTSHSSSLSSSSLPFTISDPSDDVFYSIVIDPLPTVPGYIQDLALVYITDHSGAVVSPKSAFGQGITIHLESDSVSFSDKSIRHNDSVSKIRGLIHGETNNGSITALADWLPQMTQQTRSQNVGLPVTVDIDMPDSVYSHEGFPATAHLFRDGAAVKNISSLVDAGGSCARAGGGINTGENGNENKNKNKNKNNDMFFCTSSGYLSIFSESGSATVSISPQFSPLDVSITHASETLTLGQTHIISVASPPQSTITVDTAIRHTVSGNQITLHPANPGTYGVVIVVSKPGSTTYTETLQVQVGNTVDLAVLAQDSDGNQLGVEGAIAGTGFEHAELTDYTKSVPRQSLTVTYPASVRHGDSGYSLVSVTVSNGTFVASPLAPSSFSSPSSPSAPPSFATLRHHTNAVTLTPLHSHTILAQYEKVILLEIIGATGTGVYKPGDPVTISAPDRYVFAFLVREVLDRWQGIEHAGAQSTLTFPATGDLTITAIYKTDYTGAVAVFAAVGAALTALAFRQGNTRYYLRLVRLSDSMRGKMTRVHRRIIATANPKPKRESATP